MPTLISFISFLHGIPAERQNNIFFLPFFFDGNILKLILNAVKDNLCQKKKPQQLQTWLFHFPLQKRFESYFF